jgi:hypothetical protein
MAIQWYQSRWSDTEDVNWFCIQQETTCHMQNETIFLCSVIIRGGLIYKPGLVLQLLNVGLAVFLPSLGT